MSSVGKLSANRADFAVGERGSSYGFTEIGKFATGVGCCKLHVPFSIVLTMVGARQENRVGEHPAIRATAHAHSAQRCHAAPQVLLADRAFAMATLSFGIRGYQFLQGSALNGAKKWGTGALLTERAYGAGYCYLKLMRPEFRFRIARILGPVPLVSDVLVFYRVAGLSKLAVTFRSVNQGIMHCERGADTLSGAQVFQELVGLKLLDSMMRLGFCAKHSDSGPCLYEGSAVRGLCDVCSFDVLLKDHALRCRVPLLVDRGAQLMGDALHALDVKRLVVRGFPVGTHYTEIVKLYACAEMQASYLKDVLGVRGLVGYSNHTVANEFERLYSGDFRYRYLRWLRLRLTAHEGFRDLGRVESLMSLMFVEDSLLFNSGGLITIIVGILVVLVLAGFVGLKFVVLCKLCE